MPRATLRKIFNHFTREFIERQNPDGSVDNMRVAAYGIAILAQSYTIDEPDNDLRGDDAVLDAIIKVGDFNYATYDLKKGFVDDQSMGSGFDEWRMIAWLEATIALGDKIDADRQARWREHHIAFAERILSHCIDMDTFDGQIPNHGIWNHAYFYRVGQVFSEKRFLDMATHAISRVLDAQTLDGCWREGQSGALFKGSHVTNYNHISAMAINLYAEWSQDQRAFAALDRAWHWYYDYVLPNFSSPPNFTIRQPYEPRGGRGGQAAYNASQPEGAYIVKRGLEASYENMQKGPIGTPHGMMFLALLYPFIKDVEERKPTWPSHQKLIQEEAGVRRRHKWHAYFAGMLNAGLSNVGPRLFVNERQDHLALYHEDVGLLFGSAHSKMDVEASTFCFYETGKAYYLADEAYYKATDALDTMLLRYGSNVGAASIDTTDADTARVIFSLHGERGHNPDIGRGHAMSAMAAKAHLMIRVEPDDVITIGDKQWTVQETHREQCFMQVEKDQPASFGKWSITCTDGEWQLRWPMRLAHHYKIYNPGERVAVLEVLLHRGAGTLGQSDNRTPRPTAEFHINVG